MSKCPFGSEGNYVEEEDCHCFCCGSHDGRVNTRNPKEVNKIGKK